MTKLKAFRLDSKLVMKLSALSKKTKRSEKHFVEEALIHYFNDYEDAMIARERFEDPHTELLSSRELKRRLSV
ncbi:MAG: hypothetical protein HQL11_01500 [Candidatus Omnitrophica bacterium]|nr:hypothetical protein [Candidatus Omnitrophota bacterium]